MVAPALADPAVASPPPTGPNRACATQVPVSTLEAALAGAEAAWGIDEPAFRRGVEAGRAALACAAGPLSPDTAARVHRVEGLMAFLDRDTGRVASAFAAARALDPSYTFPEAMIGARNPVRVAYDAAPPSGGTRPVPPPARRVTLWVDGEPVRARPDARAAIVQVQVADAPMGASVWVLPDDPLPDYRLRGEGLRVPMLIGAGALAAGAGVLWALGADARVDAFEEIPLSEAERAERQDTANTLGALTVSVGAAAAATGVSAFLFARW